MDRKKFLTRGIAVICGMNLFPKSVGSETDSTGSNYTNMGTVILKPKPGVIDRTPDILRAINSLPMLGGTIHFCAGIYFLKSALQINKPNVLFSGEGGHIYSISTCRCADASKPPDPTPCPDLPYPCSEGTGIPNGGVIGAATELRFMPDRGWNGSFAIKALKQGFGMRDICVTIPGPIDEVYTSQPGNNVAAVVSTLGYGFLENVLIARRYRPGIYTPFGGTGLWLDQGAGFKVRGCKITGFGVGVNARASNSGLSIFQTNIELNDVGVVIGEVNSVARVGITESMIENNYTGNIHIKKALNVCLDNNYAELSHKSDCFHLKIESLGEAYTSMHVSMRNNYISGQPNVEGGRYTGIIRAKHVRNLLIEDTYFVRCPGKIISGSPTTEQHIRASHVTVRDSGSFDSSNPFGFGDGMELIHSPQIIS